jgi:hypothetical protein
LPLAEYFLLLTLSKHGVASLVVFSVGASSLTTPLFAVEAVYEGSAGLKALVFSPGCLGCHSSHLSGTQRNGAPTLLNWDVYDIARANGSRIINSAVTQAYMPPAQSRGIPLNAEQRNALLAWEAAGFPQFSANTASFDFSNNTLQVPAVLVGNASYNVRLRLLTLPQSPTGMGFELSSMVLTEIATTEVAQTDPATNTAPNAIYAANTGTVTIHDIALRNNTNLAGYTRANIELQALAGTQPLRFVLSKLQLLP